MGKKIKKKARSAHKEKGVSSNTLHSVREPSNPTVDTEKERVSVAKERKPCNHIDKGVDLDKISSKIEFEDAVKCEDCRDGPARDRKVGKGRGKQGKKKGVGSVDLMLEPKCIWVCLECGHCACGGAVGDLVPQNHALRHARQTRHPCAVQFDNPLLSWCFSCNSVISTEKTEEHSERNDILSEVQELIKRCSSKGAAIDVEDIWFSGGELGKKLENGECLVSDARIYVVRGLVNLGNTCFFNSVMQNLRQGNPQFPEQLSMTDMGSRSESDSDTREGRGEEEEKKKKKGMEIEGYKVEGLSIGGQETCVMFPTLKIAFDIGRCPQRAISHDFLLISHAHMDHIGGLPMYVATRGLYSMKPPTIIVPVAIKENVEKLFEVHRAMDQSELKHNLIGLNVGEEFHLRNDLKVKAFRTYHGIPSQGYIIYSVRHKLKKEYIGLSGNEIKSLKLSGVEITYSVVSPEIAFTGDTMSDFIVDSNNSDVLRARVLVMESTFVDNRITVEHARDYGHTHLSEIVSYADRFENKAILLIHFSARYQIDEIVAALSALPPSLAHRVFALTEGF